MFDYTMEEKKAVIDKYFQSGDTLSLIRFPKKLKQKYLCLLWVIDLFDVNKEYTEKEVNQILKPVYADYVMLRRYLVDFNLLDRKKDGSLYWLRQSQ